MAEAGPDLPVWVVVFGYAFLAVRCLRAQSVSVEHAEEPPSPGYPFQFVFTFVLELDS
jgi:hypothetical protein